MLSIENVSSASAAMGYYSIGGAANSKYITESEWFGKGAEQLDLSGKITREDFLSILEGRLPNGEELGKTNSQGEREHAPGIDMTFSAPKSVSIAAEVLRDSRVIKAHNESVKTTLRYVESNFMQTRVKVTGEVHKDKVNNMIASLFTQHESREQDPQLHTHCVIANAVQKENGDWRSAFLKDNFDHKLFLGAVYRAELAVRLQKLGYEIENQGGKGFFELKEIPKELREVFSTRANEINKIAKELGVSDAVSKSEITKLTQKSKEPTEYKDLQDRWQKTYEKFDLKIEKPKADKSLKVDSANQVKEAVSYAIGHMAERQTVFTKEEILKNAVIQGMGNVSPGKVEAHINKLIEKKVLFTATDNKLLTTKEAYAREKHIIEMVASGKEQTKSVCNEKDLRALQKTELNKGQKDAVRLILGSKDRVVGIQGYAGTGKTFMINAAKDLAEKKQHSFIGLAPTGAAAKELEKGGKIQAQTLHSFLGQYAGVAEGRGTENGIREMTQEFKGKTLIVDESSMIANTHMENLMKISERLNIKMVMVGDVKQLGAVEAGKPFDIMQRAGMQVAYMDEIIRQRNEQLKQAVYSVVNERSPIDAINKAFDKVGKNIVDLDKGTKVQSEQVAAYVAAKYCALSKQEQQNTIVTAQANETRNLLNRDIRQIYIKEGVLGKEGYNREVLHNKSFTDAQKGKAFNYKEKDVLLINRDLRGAGLKKDSYMKVEKIDHKGNQLFLSGSGKAMNLDLNKIGNATKNIEVYQSGIKEFRKGDRILFTRSEKSSDILNSLQGKITEISKTHVHIKTDTGRDISFSKTDNAIKHIDHAYAITVHRAQGKTINNIIGVMESWRKNLTTQRSFYVTISRAKNKATLVTDNKANLANELKKNTGYKMSALEHQNDKSISKGGYGKN